MNKAEIKKLMELSTAERLELARKLEASVRHDRELRYVPLERQQVAFARECLEMLAQEKEEAECCEVIEA